MTRSRRWWVTVAAAGGAGIATWLYRRAEWEERQSAREHESWIRRQRQLELDGRRLHEAWRAHQPGDWR
jgi:hypothetical protein